jgi:predicted RNase H-like HicB family nuclease
MNDLNYYLNLKYKIITEKEIDNDTGETWYISYTNEFGKFSCYGLGETPEESIHSFKKELKSFVTYLYENNKFIPKPKN